MIIRTALLATLAFTGFAGHGLAVELGRTTTVSPAVSPFAGCTADDVAGQDGTNYPGSEIEPFIEAHPKGRTTLIAGWQQDRWSNGGARGLAAGYSLDGGRSWAVSVPPGISKCSGGPYQRASDPWVTLSPNGVGYFMSLAFDSDLPDGRFGANAMLVNRTVDGGRTWSAPITLKADGVGQALNDKNSMTADPDDSRYVYAAWDRLVDYTLPAGLKADGGRGARLRALFLRSKVGAAASARAEEVIFEGPTTFTRTTDGGKTWEPTRVVFDPGPNAQTINNLIEVGPGRRVHLFFTHITSEGRAFIALKTSRDHGATFGALRTVAEIQLGPEHATITPDTEEGVRDASILFDTAIDEKTGKLAVVWQDVRFNGVEAIAYAESRDGGRTWSAPIRINKTPRNANPLRRQAFVPSIEFLGRRAIVTYYDFRNDDGTGERTDGFVASCPSFCSNPKAWGREARLTEASFDLAKAPVARGYFLGDYMGLTVAGSRAIPLFGVAGPAAGDTTLKVRPISAGWHW